MVTVLSLWLPILLSAVAVFAASSIIHMVLGYHASDYAPVPGEESVGAAIRGAGVAPGTYVMPYAGSMKAMGTPEFTEKMTRGPVAMITVLRPGRLLPSLPPLVSAAAAGRKRASGSGRFLSPSAPFAGHPRS